MVQPESPIWLNVVAAVIFFVVLGAVAFWRYQRKTRGLEHFADNHNFTYREGSASRVSLSSEFLISKQAERGREIRHLAEGEYKGFHVQIFDFHFVSEVDHRQRSYRYPTKAFES